jgi:hypothetical protein
MNGRSPALILSTRMSQSGRLTPTCELVLSTVRHSRLLDTGHFIRRKAAVDGSGMVPTGWFAQCIIHQSFPGMDLGSLLAPNEGSTTRTQRDRNAFVATAVL